MSRENIAKVRRAEYLLERARALLLDVPDNEDVIHRFDNLWQHLGYLEEALEEQENES